MKTRPSALFPFKSRPYDPDGTRRRDRERIEAETLVVPSSGGGAGTLALVYAIGSSAAAQTMLLLDGKGGTVVFDATTGAFSTTAPAWTVRTKAQDAEEDAATKVGATFERTAVSAGAVGTGTAVVWKASNDVLALVQQGSVGFQWSAETAGSESRFRIVTRFAGAEATAMDVYKGGFEVPTNASLPASTAGTARLRFNGTNFQASYGGAAYVDLGGAGGSVGGSGSAGQAAYWSAGTTLAGSAYFLWDNTNSRLGIGIGAPLTTLHAQANDAVTTAITNVLTLTHLTSGTAAAGYGTGLLFAGEDALGGADDMFGLAASWDTATSGNEGASLLFQSRYAGSGLTTIGRMYGGGTAGSVWEIGTQGTGASDALLYFSTNVRQVYWTLVNASGDMIMNFNSSANFVQFGASGTGAARFSYGGSYVTMTGLTGTVAPVLTITDVAHTALTASTERNIFKIVMASSLQFETGTLATQRAVYFEAPTYRFVAGSTITTATNLFTSAPNAGTNATITNLYGLAVGAATAAGPSAASSLYAAITVPGHTVTYTGTTNITGTGPAAMRIEQMILSDASAMTVTNASSLYIKNAPQTDESAIVLTNSYAIWVDAGVNRFDDTVQLGMGSLVTGQLEFHNATNTNITTFQAGVATSAVVYTLPTAGPASNGMALTSTIAGFMSWAAAGASSADIQEFTLTSQSPWTKPTGAKWVKVILVGAGGGGGGGRSNSGNNSGGGGGGGGSVVIAFFAAADLAATETITVGVGGTGGTDQTDGGNGGTSQFGSWITAYGGGGGAGGLATANAAGGGGASVAASAALATGGAPAATAVSGTTHALSGQGTTATTTLVLNSEWGGATGGYGVNAAAGNVGASSLFAGPGGGAGGGRSDAAGFAGGNGGQTQSYTAGGGGAGGAANANGTAGNAKGGPSTGPYCGDGGGGGGGSSGSTSGTGGAGGAPGAGGGGGGSETTGSGTAAAGGVGGRGEVVVITFF